MRVEAVLTVVVAFVAILYGLFPEDCNYVAHVLGGAVLTELNAPSEPVKSNNGETVLMRTAATGHVAMAIMLLDDGHDPNRQDQDGVTALMRAVQGGHTDVVRVLLEEGAADPNLQTNAGGTALMHASFKGHADIVRILLHSKANPLLLDEYGGTALMRAAHQGHTQALRVILEESSAIDRAAFIDVKNKYDGYTALMRATQEGHLECVRTLIEFGAPLSTKNLYGQPVLTIAREKKLIEISKILMEAGALEDLKLEKIEDE